MKIFIAGDSTAAVKAETAYPETGWGEAFRFYLDKKVELRNYAVNGRSTKSFITDGLLDKIEGEIAPGDYLLIQFGHNDGKVDDSSRYTEPYQEYRNNLVRFVEVAKKAQATPILITSIPRRTYIDGKFQNNNIGPYPDVMRHLSKEENIHLLDANYALEKVLIELGQDKNRDLFLHLDNGEHANYPSGIEDNTHLSPLGARVVAEQIVNLILDNKAIELKDSIKKINW